MNLELCGSNDDCESVAASFGAIEKAKKTMSVRKAMGLISY